MSLSRTQWETILNEASPPTYGEIISVLEERSAFLDKAPADIVEDAIANGTLIEGDGLFGELELAADDANSAIDIADNDVRPTHGEESGDSDESADEERRAQYVDIKWTATTGVFPETALNLPHWMPVDGKRPIAPYASTENRRSWSNPANWTDYKTAEKWREMHPQLTGLAFILQSEHGNYNGDPDPFLFVDYDDVIDEETGEPCEEALEMMECLGMTYTDISTSGTGVHQVFEGQLPETVRKIEFDLPNDAGSIEIYDSKRVMVATGKHVPETPTDIQPVDEEAFEDLIDKHGQKRSTNVDREDWEPDFDRDELNEMDGTSNIQAIFDAIRQVQPRDIRLRSSKTEERPDGTLSFDPSWASSDSGKRLGWDPDIGWIYRKGDRGLDALQVVALEEPIISSVDDYPQGEDFWKAVEALRDRGARIPEFETEEQGSAQPTSALPIGQLEALDHQERKRAAQKRGLDWPSTREARDELFATISKVMSNEDTAVVDAPTSLGKSHTVATTAWNSDSSLDQVTGNGPVIHLHATRDARDEAIEAAYEADIDYFVLQSRHEACDVAAGDYDPPAADADEEIDYTPITMNGTPASDWLQAMCDGRGIPFSAAHRRLEEHNDQGVDLPCCSGDTTYDEEEGDFEETPSTCPAISQWESFRALRDEVDVVFATHNFAHVPGLRMGTNIVIDEEPDFVQDLTKERVEKAITAYLQAIDAPVTTWEAFIQLSRLDQYGTDAAAERDQLRGSLDKKPALEHYFEDERAHTLAPALARAIFNAEERANGRRFGKTPHQPPRLDATVRDDDGWNREWVSVCLDEDNNLRSVRSAPDFSQARSVVGLDAWPARPKWMVNVHPDIHIKDVLDAEERQLWRRFERGLRVVQVGDATRPLASGEYFNERQVSALVEHLVDEFGGGSFRTAITTMAVEGRLKQIMDDAGCVDPATMHYGEEKSRNDFANERVGVVNGCIDPGDDYVVDLLAELDLEAAPETVVDDEGEEQRAHGRGFEGPDADVAEEILASVRENHTAQAAGRYARDPSNDDSHATVFVRTDAMPAGLADVQISGVEWVYTDTQREIVETLRSSTSTMSTREIADSVGCSKEHVRKTLSRLRDRDHGRDAVQAFERSGTNGATLYADAGAPNAGVVDLDAITNDHVLDSYTWSLAIRDPIVNDSGELGPDAGSSDQSVGVWDWKAGPGPGD